MGEKREWAARVWKFGEKQLLIGWDRRQTRKLHSLLSLALLCFSLSAFTARPLTFSYPFIFYFFVPIFLIYILPHTRASPIALFPLSIVQYDDAARESSCPISICVQGQFLFGGVTVTSLCTTLRLVPSLTLRTMFSPMGLDQF